MRIMLVEDDPLVRETLAEQLHIAGFDITEATGSEVALEYSEAFAFPPSVIVSDIDLGPGLNGFELGAALRQRWPTVRVIYITGCWSNLEKAKLGRHERYLLKPFSPEHLVLLAHELMASSAAPATLLISNAVRDRAEAVPAMKDEMYHLSPAM
jgi:DNA-binding response OmpR family regulator